MTYGDDILDPFILTWGTVADAVSVGADPSACTLEPGERSEAAFPNAAQDRSWWFLLPSDSISRRTNLTLIGDGASAGQWVMRLFYQYPAGSTPDVSAMSEGYSGYGANNTADPATWELADPLDAGYDWYIQVSLPEGNDPGTSLALAAVNPDLAPPSPDATIYATRAEAIASGKPASVVGPTNATIYATRATALALGGDSDVETEDAPNGTVIRATRANAGVSAPDAIVHTTHTWGVDGLKHRWRLYDPATGDRWEFLHSPNQMTSPHRPRAIDIFVTPPLYNPAIEARGGMARVYEHNIAPYEWSFSGWIRDEEQYEQLVTWTRKVNRVQLTDHFGRTWSIRFKEFDPDEKRPSHRSNWKFDYDIKATMYGAVA